MCSNLIQKTRSEHFFFSYLDLFQPDDIPAPPSPKPVVPPPGPDSPADGFHGDEEMDDEYDDDEEDNDRDFYEEEDEVVSHFCLKLPKVVNISFD